MQSAQESFGIPRRSNPPRSEIFVSSSNGLGLGSGFHIFRYSNINKAVGSDIIYLDDVNLGAKFTVITPGVYSITVIAQFASADYIGISLNGGEFGNTLLGTSIQSVADANRLGMTTTTGANLSTAFTVSSFLNAGDVVRPQVAAAGIGTQVTQDSFRIVKVSI